MDNKCTWCGETTSQVIDFGPMPIAGAFILPEIKHEDVYKYHLAVTRCLNCHLVQLSEQPEREQMFHDNYVYFSSTSQHMKLHFEDMAQSLRSLVDCSDPFIVELGSNDGILLSPLKKLGVRCLGIEPSANVASIALNQGLDTQVSFFDEEIGAQILEQHGSADIICGANVFSHLPKLDSVMKGINRLLVPNGFVVFEDPYLPLILEKMLSTNSTTNIFGILPPAQSTNSRSTTISNLLMPYPKARMGGPCAIFYPEKSRPLHE